MTTNTGPQKALRGDLPCPTALENISAAGAVDERAEGTEEVEAAGKGMEEGAMVEEGCKYVLRTDVMFQRVGG